MKPSAAKCEWPGLETAQAGDQFRETRLAVVGDEQLPIRPTAVFQHPLGEPGGVALRIDAGAFHIPEEVICQGSHAAV